MAFIKFNTAKDWSALERELNNVWSGFEQAFSNADCKSERKGDRVPSTDISEDENNFYLSLDLPGVKKEDLKINFNDGKLKVSAERKSEKAEKTFHQRERSFGNFSRSFTLPEKIEEEKIIADFKDGELLITIPKSEDAKPKDVEIKIN